MAISPDAGLYGGLYAGYYAGFFWRPGGHSPFIASRTITVPAVSNPASCRIVLAIACPSKPLAFISIALARILSSLGG